METDCRDSSARPRCQPGSARPPQVVDRGRLCVERLLGASVRDDAKDLAAEEHHVEFAVSVFSKRGDTAWEVGCKRDALLVGGGTLAVAECADVTASVVAEEVEALKSSDGAAAVDVPTRDGDAATDGGAAEIAMFKTRELARDGL